MQIQKEEEGMFGFISSMWITEQVQEEYVRDQFEKGRISAEERDIILATPTISDLIK